MSALSAGMSRPGEMILFLAIAFLAICCSRAAPVSEHDTTHIAEYETESGCYYNFQRYQEGDRIVTNEPCLNCTCHNRMLMCYLRVCPFTKAIGQNCTVEKRPDQCCPIITCPEVPVQLLTSTPNSPAIIGSTEIGAHDNYGCRVEEKFYADGAQLPVDPRNPCELCYCIRNRTTCVMQECTLRVAGCNPVYLPGVCCPVKYNCDYDEEQTTTLSPTTPGLIMTTTVAPGQSTPMCYRDGNAYNDGELIDSGRACQHCYCFRGDIVCAVQDCKIPMKIHGKHCTPQPAPEGKCCPTTYQCDGESSPTEVEEEPQLSGELPIPDHPYKEQATESPIPGLGYLDEDNNQPQQMVDVFPGADNTIPEKSGENKSGTEGPIQQETVKPFEETPIELPEGVKTENPTGTSVVEPEHTPIKSTEDVNPTEVVLPEQPVTTADEEKDAPHDSIEHDNTVQTTATADETQTEVNIDEGKPISSVESTDRTVSEDAIKTTEDLPTHGIVSEDEIKAIDELPTEETVPESPTPTEVTSNMHESNEGSEEEQVLKEPTQSGIEQEGPEEVTTEEQNSSKVPVISEPQEPVNPLPGNDEIAVEKSTALPTQAVKSDEEVTKEPAVLVTELTPIEGTKTEDSNIAISPGEVELTKPETSEEPIFPETSTLKTVELEAPEQPIKETATTLTSIEESNVFPESHQNEPEETPVSATVLPTIVSVIKDQSTEKSGSTEGHTIDDISMAKEPTQHESNIAGAVPATEVPTDEVPTSEIQTGEIPISKLPTGEVPTSEVPTNEVPSPDEVTSEVLSKGEGSKPQTEETLIDEEHPIEPTVTEEKQPEGPIAVENPSQPAAHDQEDSIDIPEQGPTGIPISDRVPVVKADDESVVHELHVTEVYDEVQHTHVPDSLIIDKQDGIPATYIPPIGGTAESEITPGQEPVTTGVVQEIVPHEEQAPQIFKETVTPPSSEKEHKPTPQEELEHEKSTVIGQLPTEATHTEILPVELGTHEDENGDKQIFNEPTENKVNASESPEVSTDVQGVELEGFPDAKPTEPQKTADNKQHHVPAEDEIAKGEQQTEKPVLNGELPTDNVAEEKPLEVPTHDEETPEVSLPEENLTGPSGDEQKPVTGSAMEEKPIKSSENESEPTEVSTAEKEQSNTPVTAEEPLTPSITEERPTEPGVADEKQTETTIPQEQQTVGPISNENPVEAGVTAEDKPSEVSISQEQETEAPINAEVPSEVNSDTQEKTDDTRITEDKPTEDSSIQEELPTVSIIDQKPTEESAVEQELTEAPASERVPTQASFDVENPVKPSSTEEKLVDTPATDETPMKTSIVDDESNVTSISNEKPTETSITGEISTQTSVAEEEPLDVGQKPNEASITENTVTDIPKSEQEPPLVTDENPTESSFVEQQITGVSTSAGESDVTIVEETSVPVTEELTESPVTEQKIFKTSATQATPTESTVQEEKITNVPAGSEIPTEESAIETKTPVAVVGEEKVTAISNEEGQDTVASVTAENLTGIPEVEQSVTDSSIIEEKPTEAPIAEHETTSGSIEEGVPSGTPIAEVESEADSGTAVSQTELTTPKAVETTSADNEPVNPLVSMEGPVDTSTIDQKTIESSTPTNKEDETIIPEEGPTKSSDSKNHLSESPADTEQDALAGENKPTDATNVEEEQTNISVSEEAVTDKNIIEVEPTGATANEQKPTGTVFMEEKPTEISVTDEKITDLPVTETKPSDASIAGEQPTNTPVSNIKETEPAEEGPTTASKSEENLPKPSVIAENSTPASVGEEKLIEPSIAAENPAENTVAEGEVTESSIVKERPVESTDIAGEPTAPSIPEKEPTKISIADEKSTISSVSENKLPQIPPIVENVPQSSVPEDQSTEVSTSDDELVQVPLSEVKPTEIAKPEEGPIEASASEKTPTAHSDTPMGKGEITGVPESQENPTEPSDNRIVTEESTKPSIVEEKPVNPITSEESPSGEPPSDEKPTVTSIIPEEPTKMVEKEKLPIEPSVGEQQPIEPSVEEQQPIEPSVGEQQPIEPSVEKQQPIEPSVGEQQPIEPSPIEPSVGEQQPIEPSVGEQQPIEPSVGEKQPIEPTIAEQQPIEPSVEEQQPIEPSIGEQQPIKPSVEEQTAITATPEQQQPSEPSKQVPSEIPSKMEKEDQTTIEQERPEVFGDNFPSSIPGEGNCLVDGQSFANNSRIPPANLCQTRCLCISSIVHCDLVECSPPPSQLSNCMPIHTNTDSCCPIYSCDSTPTVDLKSDSQMAENHTPGYEGVHVPSTDDYSKESSTPIIKYPAEPSDEVTPGSEEQSSVSVHEDTTPSIESVADLDQKIVEPIEQEIPEPNVPVQELSGVSETNEIPEQPIIDQTEQNPKPEVVDQQTEEAIMPTEEQKPIGEEKQKPESPSEVPVEAVTTNNEPDIIPVTTVGETTADQQSEGTPTSDKDTPLVSLVPVSEQSPEVIPTSETHPVETGTSSEEQTTDITKQHRPAVEIETATDQSAVPAGEDAGPEEHHAASEKPIDNDTVVPVGVLQEGEQVVDVTQPTEKEPTAPVVPVDTSTSVSEEHFENTEHPETSVTGANEQTPGLTESAATSPVPPTDQPIVESTDKLTTLISQHPEEHVPQPESDGQVIEPSTPTDESSPPKDQLDLQQQPENVKQEVPIDSSTIESDSEVGAPASTESSENQSVSILVPTDGINLSNNAETSTPTSTGQVEDEIEGSTVIPIKNIDVGLPILSSSTEVAEDEILPTEASKQGEAQTPVSDPQEASQEASASTTPPTVGQELTIDSETTISTVEEHDQVIVETEPSIISSPPVTTKASEPSGNTGEQITAVDKNEAEPISHETPATPVIESAESVDTAPESQDVGEPAASTESTEGQVTEVKETGEPVDSQGAQPSEPTANTETERTGVEEPTTRPTSSEGDIKTTTSEESVIAEQGESSEPPVSVEGESISVEIPTTGLPLFKEGTKPTLPEMTGEDHKIPTLEFTTKPGSPETAETLAPTMNQEDETVAAEHSTSSPVLIENAEKPASTANVEDQTISDVEKPAKSSEATENTEGEPDVDKKPISETALPDQDVRIGEPEVRPVSTVSSVSEESEAVTIKGASAEEIPQSGAETPPSTSSSEVQTPAMEDSEFVSPDQGVTAASGASGEEETTPAQHPAVESSAPDTKSPIPAENAEEQVISVDEFESKPASPDHPEEPVPTSQPGIVSVSQEDTEELASTGGVEKDIIPTDQTASEPTLPSEGETPVPTVTEEAVSISVEGEAISIPVSDAQTKLVVTSATPNDHGVSVEATTTASAESEESSAPTTKENDELTPEIGSTARPVISEENSETPTSTQIEVKTPETISTDAETPVPNTSEDEKVITTESPQPDSSYNQEVPTAVSHDETKPQSPIAGTPEQTVTAETPTTELVATDHVKTPEFVSSEEGENGNAEVSTAGLIDQDHIETSAPTESSVDENTPVKETRPSQVSEEEAVVAGHPTEDSGLFEHAETPIPSTKPDQDTATDEQKIIEPPKSIEQSTSTSFTPEESTIYPKEGVPTTQSISEEVPTQSTMSESVKPELVPIDEQVKQEQMPVDITPIEGQPEEKPVTPELEEANKTSEPSNEPATDVSNEPATEKPSVGEESLIKSTKPAPIEGESMESNAENTAGENEKPISAGSPIPDDQKPTRNEQPEVPQKEYDTEHQVTEISAPVEFVPPVTPAEPTNEDQEHVQTPDQTQEVPEQPAVDSTEGQLTIGSQDSPVPQVHDSIDETKPAMKPGYFGRPITSTLAPQGSLAYPDQTVSGEDNSHFPVNNGTYLNPESDDTGDSDDYEEDDLDVYGPGTCRYGGKVYVSAQQIPRDDPCDFCFCFRSDIICLQQSCPPPIPGCHEEPINGFCCPRYECPVSMATSLNLTTTTTTTTTTLPPHFLSHAYKGAARRSGCQIRGQAYRVGESIPSASGPCLECTCGGDGNMKCEPRVCSPEPMLRQMIAAATAKRRR
ncbi:mucin-17 [Diprion similis]|uniref:mucin-17 n=1 Tax=Diprion similis TaxID=362088 RepID=UPI001EF99313|nr:mucin-17 [Diprion similis]